MLCSECPEYSHPLLRCLRGKVNPKTKTNTVEIIDIMGLDYICEHNEFKLEIVQERVFKSDNIARIEKSVGYQVVARCINCGERRDTLPGEVDEGDMPMCDCGSVMVADSAHINMGGD